MDFKKMVEGLYAIDKHPYPTTIIKCTDDYFEFERLNTNYRITRDINFEDFILKKHGISCISAFGSTNNGYYNFDLYFGLNDEFYTLETDFNANDEVFQFHVRKQTKKKVISPADILYHSAYADVLNQLTLDLKERIYEDKLLRLGFATGLINLEDYTILVKDK